MDFRNWPDKSMHKCVCIVYQISNNRVSNHTQTMARPSHKIANSFWSILFAFIYIWPLRVENDFGYSLSNKRYTLDFQLRGYNISRTCVAKFATTSCSKKFTQRSPGSRKGQKMYTSAVFLNSVAFLWAVMEYCASSNFEDVVLAIEVCPGQETSGITISYNPCGNAGRCIYLQRVLRDICHTC